MKRILPFLLIFAMLFAGCYTTKPIADPIPPTINDETVYDGVEIELFNSMITVDGAAADSDRSKAVYVDNDIIYYEDGHDFTYGEGSSDEAHSASLADEHSVVHITQPGVYILSGNLSCGQVAVDLGEDAKDDPNAAVTLVLNGLDIACNVAPAIIFYNVYECGDAGISTKDVDTSAAGARVIIADSRTNTVIGSHVARIYESYTLSEDGSEVADSKTLHKYDGAFYSRMSMEVSGGERGSGILNIVADNEGLDSEMHLTINSGIINITAGNDGINTNEDGVSVTTINGGTLSIRVNGDEGDGIDSNGWIVINGGTVSATAHADSMDSGLDADMGIYINGGHVASTGNMLDTISEDSQTYAVFSFGWRQEPGEYSLKNADGKELKWYVDSYGDYVTLLVSDPGLVPGAYTLYKDGEQLSGAASDGFIPGTFGGFGGFDAAPPEHMEPMEGDGPYFYYTIPSESMEPPEDGDMNFEFIYPEGERPKPEFDDGFSMPPPEHSDGFIGMEPPDHNDGFMGRPGGEEFSALVTSSEFVINAGANYFVKVGVY